jgi:hypothetical protein
LDDQLLNLDFSAEITHGVISGDSMAIRRFLAVITQQIRGFTEPRCCPSLSSTNNGLGEYPPNAVLSPNGLLKIGGQADDN